MLVTQLDELIAKRYAETATITESENDQLEQDSEGYAFGFSPDSVVYVNEREIGTVSEIIEKFKGTDRYDYIEKNLNVPEINNINNAWVKEEIYKGAFVDVEIEDDCVDAKGVTDQFFEKFINNIDVSDEYLFQLSEWEGKEVDEDGIHGKSSDYFVIYNGDVIELNVQ